MQFLPLPPGSPNWQACQCPNEKNRNAFAQGVSGPPIWIEKTCTNSSGQASFFQQINIDFAHKVTSGCPDGHVARGFLTVVVKVSDNGLPTFGGDFKPNMGNPFPPPSPEPARCSAGGRVGSGVGRRAGAGRHPHPARLRSAPDRAGTAVIAYPFRGPRRR